MSNEIEIYGQRMTFSTKNVHSRNGRVYQYVLGRMTLPAQYGHNGQHQTSPRPPRKEFSGKTREEVVAKAYAFLRREHNTTLPEAPLTFGQWAETCFERMYRYREQTTITSYRRMNTYLMDDLGDILLPALTPQRLQQTIDTLVDRKLSPTRIHATYSLLNRYMKAAVAEGHLATNPAATLVLPPKRIEHHPILTTQEIEELFRLCQTASYGNFYLVTLLCALRRGEALGLSDDEVDERRGRITIRQQYRSSTKSFEKTKTKRMRTIYPPTLTFSIIERQLDLRESMSQKKPSVWNNERGLIFTTRTGGPLNGTYVEECFKKVAASLGRPELTLHDLRRSSASIAMYLSGNPTAVQNMLGHTSLGMTYYYCEATSEQMQEFSHEQDVYYTELFKRAWEHQ